MKATIGSTWEPRIEKLKNGTRIDLAGMPTNTMLTFLNPGGVRGMNGPIIWMMENGLLWINIALAVRCTLTNVRLNLQEILLQENNQKQIVDQQGRMWTWEQRQYLPGDVAYDPATDNPHEFDAEAGQILTGEVCLQAAGDDVDESPWTQTRLIFKDKDRPHLRFVLTDRLHAEFGKMKCAYR